MSVSKRLLVSWNRQSGYVDEASQRQFAYSLERYFGRFAFPNDFNKSLDKLRKAIIKAYRKPESEFGKVVRSIQEIRVRPSPGWSDEEQIDITFVLVLKAFDEREEKSLSAIIKRVFDESGCARLDPPLPA